jgi:hypothetical protein
VVFQRYSLYPGSVMEASSSAAASSTAEHLTSAEVEAASAAPTRCSA